MPISPTLAQLTVKFSHRLARMTKTKFSPEKFDEIFRPIWFCSRKLFEVCSVPTAFVKFVAFSLATLRSDAFLPCLSSRPWLKLTMPKKYGFRSFLAADEKEKKN